MSTAVNEVLFGRIGRLKDTYRYSSQPTISRENVAEHSFWTAMIGVTIAFEVMETVAPKVALKAILHDIEECMTGDLVRDMKYANPDTREAIAKVEREFIGRLLRPMGEVGGKILMGWEDSKDDTLAGQIVLLSDTLSVIQYCTKEMELGNTNLTEIKDACAELIRKRTDIAELREIAYHALDETTDRWNRNA